MENSFIKKHSFTDLDMELELKNIKYRMNTDEHLKLATSQS